jgi:hypothetical protein
MFTEMHMANTDTGRFEAERRYIAEVSHTVIKPAQAAYRRLVEELAANSPDVGYYDVKQLRPLSNAERAVILEANPDVLNDIVLEPDELVAILRGQLDADTWMASLMAAPLRKWLFEDVCAEVERDEQIVRQGAIDAPHTQEPSL